MGTTILGAGLHANARTGHHSSPRNHLIERARSSRAANTLGRLQTCSQRMQRVAVAIAALPAIHTPLPQPLDVLLVDLGIVLLPCRMPESSLMHTTTAVMMSMIAVVEDRRSAHLRRAEAVSSQRSRMGWRARCATSPGAGFVQLS